jgi:hypothetical protein
MVSWAVLPAKLTTIKDRGDFGTGGKGNDKDHMNACMSHNWRSEVNTSTILHRSTLVDKVEIEHRSEKLSPVTS